MNSFLHETPDSRMAGPSASNSILKSGAQTPGATSKILRWKDLEAAVMQVTSSTGREARDLENMFEAEGQAYLTEGRIHENEECDIEELFV